MFKTDLEYYESLNPEKVIELLNNINIICFNEDSSGTLPENISALNTLPLNSKIYDKTNSVYDISFTTPKPLTLKQPDGSFKKQMVKFSIPSLNTKDALDLGAVSVEVADFNPEQPEQLN